VNNVTLDALPVQAVASEAATFDLYRSTTNPQLIQHVINC